MSLTIHSRTVSHSSYDGHLYYGTYGHLESIHGFNLSSITAGLVAGPTCSNPEAALDADEDGNGSCMFGQYALRVG